ncbi:hypothetical protein CLCAR_2030 [Clostridium carboxidivorans P7]|nr:hypothetical protein CLCAR_2030 [Clostridium carboxidivorans P7]
MENNLDIIKKLMMQYNRPFYIYNGSVISKQIEILLKNFSQFEFYSG